MTHYKTALGVAKGCLKSPAASLQDALDVSCNMPFCELSTEEKQQLKDELKKYLEIKQPAAHVIDDGKYLPWVKNIPEEKQNYSKRYLEYLESSGFSKNVIETINKTSKNVLDHLGNPASEEGFKRKGLVVGHVQSGKTANYISLINLAADSGYKLIILIAGIHNNLRAQTQERINEGFIGYDWLKKENVGVGIDNGDGQELKVKDRPITLTNTEKDFNRQSQEVSGFTPENTSVPVILVIKKNYNTLNNIISWLKAGSKKSNTLNKYPTLIIDDEADNASINTKKNPNETTRINNQIRTVLNMFEKVSYVGFTATPFANIFIDPNSTNEMLKDDLFPDNFIFSLEAPSNYIGPKDFFTADENGENELCCFITDNREHIPMPLPREFTITSIPKSLEDAIREYLLAAVVKKIRGINPKHSSMLINISHKTDMQRQVQKLVHDKHEQIKRALKFEGSKSLDQALKNKEINKLHEVYQQKIRDNSISFEKILSELVDFISNVEVKLINSQSQDRLNYKDYEDGLHVIAIGGYSLSRGLTLEGLLVSYLIRNTKTYDTLVQMGRWFGYRDGYQDLCRVYLPPQSFDWYCFISQACDELRDEFRLMEINSLTPRDYGLKIRSSPDGLLITARNKMYQAESFVAKMSFSETSASPLLIPIRGPLYEHNKSHFYGFIKQLNTRYSHQQIEESNTSGYLWSNVTCDEVLEFLQKHEYVSGDILDDAGLREYITEGRNQELENWDVFFAINGTGSKIIDLTEFFNREVVHQIRTLTSNKFHKNNGNEAVSFTDGGGRIARIWEEAHGLSEREKAKVEQLSIDSETKQTARYYREVRKQPLLILKLFEIRNNNDKSDPAVIANHVPVFAISFPKSLGASRLVKYQVNKIYQQFQFNQEDEEIDSDE